MINNYERILNDPNILTQILSFLKDVKDNKNVDLMEKRVVVLSGLNETEKQKAEETRKFIALHASKKDEIEKINKDIAAKKLDIQGQYEKLGLDKKSFLEEVESKKLEHAKILESAQSLNSEAMDRHKTADEKEAQLRQDMSDHQSNLSLLAKDKGDIEKQRAELNALSDSLKRLDRETKEKLDALKRFNF